MMTVIPHKVLVVFAHGKESGPMGSKILHLSDIAKRFGAEVLSPDYSDLDDADQRVDRLLALKLPSHDMLILVGSSMGGYVSTVASQVLKPVGMFLMAPAFGMPGYAMQNPMPGVQRICIVHGWQDETIPVDNVLRFAQAHCTELHVIEGDHRLTAALPTVGRLFDDFLHRLLKIGNP